MPTFRPDLASIPRYTPGRPISEVARELGLVGIDKLASNEWPTGPFPEVVDAIAAAAAEINRYPDSSCYELTGAIAADRGVARDAAWVGAGSSEILRCTALSVGGPHTSAVFAAPSFVMYTISTMIAGARPITVPLTKSWDHDLARMLEAIEDDTTIVYVCNPNNPTGGIRSRSDILAFIEAVPERVLVVVDEAYAEFVTDPEYGSLIDVAVERPNVLVARTFSKVFGLAGLRIGFGISHPDTIARLRATQAPFTVSTVAQVAALESLKHPDRIAERSAANEEGRRALTDGLTAAGYDVAPSQANFVYFEPAGDPKALERAMLERGVIVRVLGRGVRITVGTEGENHRLLEAIEAVAARA